MRDVKPISCNLDTEIGLYSRVLARRQLAGRPCLFLDRDGVLVDEVNYLSRVEDISFIPGVAEEIARASARGVAVVMVTNQAGIGRGYYDWAAFDRVQAAILDHYRAQGALFDMVLACAYHAEGRGPYAVPNHPWRKPGPGMLIEAARVLQIDLAASFIVGDTLSDLAAGQTAGLRRGALVLTGHGPRDQAICEPTFAAWRADRSFEPSIADTAATAIRAWLET